MASNFIRCSVGSTLTAQDILRSGLCVIKACMPDRPASAEPATIEIPPARRFEGKELTIVDSAGMGFLVIPSDGDIVYGDIAMRSAVRLVPLVGDGDEEPDGWGVV
jgi:hypothetical protein